MLNYLRRTRRSRIIIAALLLLIIAAVACTSSSEDDSVPSVTVAPTAAVVGNYETCKGFINSDLIEGLSGETDLIDRERALDRTAAPELVASGALNNCLIEVFKSLDSSSEPTPGKSVTLTVVVFESNQFALDLFDSTLASVLLIAEQVDDLGGVTQEVIGTDSYLLDVDVAGIGAMVAYVSDTVFVSMSSASDSDGNALLDGEQLVSLAQGVKFRLPEFAQTRFTDG